MLKFIRHLIGRLIAKWRSISPLTKEEEDAENQTFTF
jgi:hypothetical protein